MNQGKQLSAFSLMNLQVSGAICLPVILIGSYLGKTYTFKTATLAILLGNALLCILGILFSNLAFKYKFSSMEMARRFLGRFGGKALTFIFCLSMTFWIGAQQQVLLESLAIDLGRYEALSLTGGLFLLLLLSILKKVKVIEKTAFFFSILSVLIFIGSALYQLSFTDISFGGALSYRGVLSGTLLMVSFSILAVIDFPTYFQYARSKRDIYIANVGIFCFALPCIEIFGAMLASRYEEGIHFFPGAGAFLQGVNGVFIFLACLTSNQMNLYSCVINSSSILKMPYAIRATLFAVLGFIFYQLPILQNLEYAVTLIAMPIISMGVMVLILSKARKKDSIKAFFLVLLSSLLSIYLSRFIDYPLEVIVVVITLFLSPLSMQNKVKEKLCS